MQTVQASTNGDRKVGMLLALFLSVGVVNYQDVWLFPVVSSSLRM